MLTGHYVAVADVQARSIHTVIADPTQCASRVNDSFVLFPTHQLEIKQVIRSFKFTLAYLHYIHSSVFRQFMTQIVAQISNLINYTFLPVCAVLWRPCGWWS